MSIPVVIKANSDIICDEGVLVLSNRVGVLVADLTTHSLGIALLVELGYLGMEITTFFELGGVH